MIIRQETLARNLVLCRHAWHWNAVQPIIYHLPPPQAKPLAQHDPLATWCMLAVLSIVANVLMLYILIAR
ncbi:hypothetical protein ACO0LG_20485 [Undibacterium sp. Ji42W]|uniref:hypothetical protein n=1 Tax=Undibacterium sp. Ji42W TaxID=3413039 RepID=UPI003BF22717